MKDRTPEELRADWVKALRSGKYEQGTGCLRDRNQKYCCLGVLADVLYPEKWSTIQSNGDYEFPQPSGYMSSTEVGPDIDRMVGMTEEIESKLISMNDDDEYTFQEIADYIERGFTNVVREPGREHG